VSKADSQPLRAPRTLSKDARKVQIIEATIATIAERGYSRTTVTDVARRAGLSHGLLLFHFESKDRLLAETLDYLSDEYRSNWQSALAAAGDPPEEQLAALIEADFKTEVCRPDRLGAWCAFWGESQSLPPLPDALRRQRRGLYGQAGIDLRADEPRARLQRRRRQGGPHHPRPHRGHLARPDDARQTLQQR
jgi:AcrR family transcriptional regulator